MAVCGIFCKRILSRATVDVMKQQHRTFLWKKRGLTRDFIAKMQQPLDLSSVGLKRRLVKKRNQMLKDSHRYLRERHAQLGPDLAAAVFVIARGGAAKFVDMDEWFQLQRRNKINLPNSYNPAFKLEGIDATNTAMMYESLENFVDLEYLRYLNLSQCELMTDWCMDRLQMFSYTLEHLDLSGCPSVTENGLAALHKLRKLKYINISDMPKVKEKELITIMLEEAIPGCVVQNSDVDLSVNQSQEVDSEEIPLEQTPPEETQGKSAVTLKSGVTLR